MPVLIKPLIKLLAIRLGYQKALHSHSAKSPSGVRRDGLFLAQLAKYGDISRWLTIAKPALSPSTSSGQAPRSVVEGSLVIAAAMLLMLPATLHAAGEFTGLGFLPGDLYSRVSGISADGSVAVGFSSTGGKSADQAFRWTQATNMQSIDDWLAGAGVNLPDGWGRLEAKAVNLDGSVVVGDGISSAEGYRTGWRIKMPATAPVR